VTNYRRAFHKGGGVGVIHVI